PLLVGLDATLDALLTDDDVALAAEGRTPAGGFLADPLVEYAKYYARSEQVADGRFACHDLLAALAVAEPEVLTDVQVLPISVDTGGSAAWGSTVADRRRRPDTQAVGYHPWRVALGADERRFRTVFRTMVGGEAPA
ncbi:MAG: nucleoside hydrolase, partial [Acidimicrobiia bacterium]|nr:nucleoside hydrolase [Acidimicrobiia bacterium]